MECPYISVAPNQKICRLMTAQGLEGELDNFDITHYCKGNPNHCYFYRLCFSQEPIAESSREDVPLEKTQVAFFNKLSEIEVKKPETSIDQNESPPVLFKLIRRGFRDRAKPEIVDRLFVRLRRK
ncbi:MAG: hypothetical protein PVF15_10970 [Candidatus Bathyarchaeota archaeon]|jgi:hypothetical protein